MGAKSGSAALALLALVSFAAPAAAASAPAGGAQIAQITRQGFEEMLATSVEDKGGVKTEDGDTLRVELHDEARVLFFTRPGHRAHPAIVEVQIVEAENGPDIDTSGWWAGDARAFEHWFRVFQRRNERLARQWQQESGPF